MQPIVYRLSVDFQRPDRQTIYAKQGDSLTRTVAIELFNGGTPLTFAAADLPDEIRIAYNKPDGTEGLYSSLPDGTAAATLNGNELSVTLAPQALTAPGTVIVDTQLLWGGGERLTAFSFLVSVEPSAYSGAISDSYYNFRSNIVRGTRGNNDEYAGVNSSLPTIAPGSVGGHQGKGTQIVFIPEDQSTSNTPKLKLNGGQAIEIRVRGATYGAGTANNPEAEKLEPGMLLRGVPYVLTFCGKYWLVDSLIV